ncbi:MAG: TonB family protein [Thermodesulfobacteriota bacterium]|nr:TonB family protein [Thermodesulfobacteriota bacterium]
MGMKRDLVLSAIIAVGVHALILIALAPRAGLVHGGTRKSILLSIVHPPAAVAPAPPAKSPSEPVSVPRPSAEQMPVPKKDLIPKKKLSAKKRLLAPKPPAKEDAVGPERAEAVKQEDLVTPKPVEHLAQKNVGSAGNAIPPSSDYRTFGQGPNGDEAFQKEPIAPAKGPGGGLITYANPTYKAGTSPTYPRVAQRRGYEGRVLLEVEILEAGDVRKVRIVSSSGFGVLDKEAVRWVKTNPFVHGPKREKRTYLVPVVFDLDEEKVLARGKRK